MNCRRRSCCIEVRGGTLFSAGIQSQAFFTRDRITEVKPHSRYRLLLVLFCVGLCLSFSAWTTVTEADPNNQGGVLLGLLGIFVVLCVYATTLVNWLLSKARRLPANSESKGSTGGDVPSS